MAPVSSRLRYPQPLYLAHPTKTATATQASQCKHISNRLTNRYRHNVTWQGSSRSLILKNRKLINPNARHRETCFCWNRLSKFNLRKGKLKCFTVFYCLGYFVSVTVRNSLIQTLNSKVFSLHVRDKLPVE